MKILTSLNFCNLTTVQRDAVGSPVAGDTIYNIDEYETQSYDGSEWLSVKKLHIIDGLRTFVAGAVSINSVLVMTKATLATTYPIGCPSSQIHALTAPTDTVVMDIATSISPYGTDVTVGTLTWSAGNAVPVIAFNTQVVQSVGDIMKIKTPNDVFGMRGLYVDFVGYTLMPVYT